MGAWSNQAVSLIVLDEATSGYSGIFGYSPAPGPGNLIFSVAAKAGTDPYGNAYPQGLGLGTGTIIIDNPTAGVFVYSGTPAFGNLIVSMAAQAGSDAFGNSYPQGLGVKAGTITGATIVADGTSGQFLVYSGTPAFGNLICSVSGAAGSDAFGNAYKMGFTNYVSATAFININNNEIQFAGSGSTPATVSGGAASMLLSTGALSSGGDVPMGVFAQSKLLSIGGASPQLCLAAGTPVPATGAMLEVQGAAQAASLTTTGNATVGAALAAVSALIGAATAPQLSLAQGASSAALLWPLNTATAYTQLGFIEGYEATGGSGQFGGIAIQSAKRTARPDIIAQTFNSSDSVNAANTQIIYTDTGGTVHLYGNVDNTGVSITGNVTGSIPGITPARPDSWSSLGTPTSWTSVTARYVAAGIINAVWVDITATAPAGGATTATFPNALPAAYRPAANRLYPLAINGTAATGVPRLSVGSNGSVQLVGLPSGFTGTVSTSVLVATN